MTAADELLLVQVLCIALLHRRIAVLERRLAIRTDLNQRLKGGES